MANNYNIMAEYIVDKYIKRISGKDLPDIFVEDDPTERIMVGMLAEDRVKTSFQGGYIENSNTRFESVPSISLSFVVKKNARGVLRVVPQGLLFYTVKPDYDMTLTYILKKYSEKDKREYRTFEELCDCYDTEKLTLPLTYKKIDFSKIMADGIEINMDGLKTSTFSLEQQINAKLKELADSVAREICIITSTRVNFVDLLSPLSFERVLSIKNEVVQPRWDIDILVHVTEEGEYLRFLMHMVNKTSVDKKNMGYLPRVFDAKIFVVGNENVEFQNLKLDYFSSSYKEREPIYAVTENTAVKYVNRNDGSVEALQTDNIPIYYQLRLKTKDGLNDYVQFDKLLDDPLTNLKYILGKMEEDYATCEDELDNAQNLSPQAEAKFRQALEYYEGDVARFRSGIKLIEYKEFVKNAFLYMNETFKTKLNLETRKNIKGWRLFQIVFIVSMIGEVVRSEYKDDPLLSEADNDMANLLYFPTGGGKTEAFLGVTVFNMFFDRIRGKNQGVTALLKYPLRLLAVQQLDRVLTIVMQANKVREIHPQLKGTTEFRVGFYVGQNNTPNRIKMSERLSNRDGQQKNLDLILDSDTETLNEYYRFIDTCPCCGKKTINIHFNRDRWTLEHICDNPGCTAHTLPLFIVDSEIYRYLPSVVVSTIDKMSMIGTTNEFKMLFGQVKKWCPTHGFSVNSKCMCSDCGCNRQVQDVGYLKDPVPTLFIQDEMHLIKESLGTFDSHYESFIYYYAKNLVKPEHRKRIRFIGATATISMYQEHIQNLYHMQGRRFPCEYPSMKCGEDFYSYTDDEDITRIILGYAPYGCSITDGMWQSVYYMRLVVYQMIKNWGQGYQDLCEKGFQGTVDDYRNMLFDYWIELVYNNRKQDAMELENAFNNQGNNFLQAKGVPLFVPEQMTSDVDFQTVRQTLFNVQKNRKNLDSTNLLLATSTISHGVDEDSFNIMYFFGMPNNNAEYIQAYSRTGRKHTGIVIDIIRLMRIRDRSYLKNFVTFHQNKDDLVESVPINRWAKNAIYSTLPGILSGVLLQYYTIRCGIDHMYHAIKAKKLLMDGAIDPEEVVRIIIGIFDCSDREKMSIAYKEIIEEEVRNILGGIENGNFEKDEFLSNAIGQFSHGKIKPMKSLRDTEEQIEIKI